MGISHFHLFFLKPQNRFEPNLAEMLIGWSYTRFLFLALIRNPTSDRQTIHQFGTGPPNDHSCKVTIQLA
jgi:hypothetical protein